MESIWQDAASTRNVCSAHDPHSPSCQIENAAEGILDAMAGTKLIISLLSITTTTTERECGGPHQLAACVSILGCLSVIASVIIKKQVTNPKVHPIFVLSVADLMLAVLWVVGPVLFFERISNRVWCYSVSLLTVVLECTTVNLTLVYAIHAYSTTRARYLRIVQRNLNAPGPEHACGPWQPLKTISVYIIAWVIPVVIVMIPFGAISGKYHIVRDANNCSCWCVPHFGNVVPFAFPSSEDQPTSAFVRGVRNLVLAYGVVVGVNYLVGFVFLVAIYCKVWTYIKIISTHDQHRTGHYGTVKFLMNEVEFQAKRRIVYFLNVFIINGFANVILSLLFVIHEAREELHVSEGSGLKGPLTVVFFMQSITVPLQGLLNAMVYGWTREDFSKVMAVEEDSKSASHVQTLIGSIDPMDSGPDVDPGLLFSVKQDDSFSGSSDQMEETELENSDD